MDIDDDPRFAERLKDAIPAATLIVMRAATGRAPDEILMVKRAHKLAFAGGMVAFPGGRVEPQDHDLAQAIASDAPTADAAARIAALRETFEETGLLCGIDASPEVGEIARARNALREGTAFGDLLESRGWTLAPSALIGFARWCPPEGIAIARRFDTRFYLAQFTGPVTDVSADGTESSEAFWAGAQTLLDRHGQGDINLVGPTRATLLRLAMGTGFADARQSAQDFPVREIFPVMRTENGERRGSIPPGHGYPDVDFRIA